MGRSAVEELAGLPHAARAYGHAWTVGGLLCLAWGFALPALFFLREWSVAGFFIVSAIVATGTAVLVLAGFLRRRRVWAAHGLWAMALAGLLGVTVFTFSWGRFPGTIGLVLFGIVATVLGHLAWNAWAAVGELQRASGHGERGFDPILRAVPLSEPAPAPIPPPDAAEAPQSPSDSVRGK